MVVRCNNAVLAWLIRDAGFDRFEEEEDGDREEEGRGVMSVGWGRMRSSTATKAARSARSLTLRIFEGRVIAGLSGSCSLTCH